MAAAVHTCAIAALAGLHSATTESPFFTKAGRRRAIKRDLRDRKGNAPPPAGAAQTACPPWQELALTLRYRNAAKLPTPPLGAAPACSDLGRASELRDAAQHRRLPLPSRWGDNPARQVPVFVRWERFVPRYLPNVSREAIFVVQVGANCGKNTYACAVGGDPVWEYATYCQWPGMVLEPVSYIFHKLCWNYLRWPAIQPLRAAVSTRRGLAEMVVGRGESNRLASAGPLSAGRRNESVALLTLADLWSIAHGERGTPTRGGALPGLTARGREVLLVIDAEGEESTILTQPLPLPLPRMILFEHAKLNRSAAGAIDANLAQHGFVLVAKLKHKDPRGLHLPAQDSLYGRPREV